MGITQKEIADALELPLITVHRALNNSGYVSKELKGRILAYARDVRYVPHKASQVLKRNKVRKIAIFSSSLPHYFWNDIRTGISIGAEQIQALNYRVNYHMVAESDSDQYLERLEEEIRDGVEAIAFVNQWIYRMDEIISRISRAGIPYVTLNVDAPESRRLCFIGPDYRAGGGLPRNTSARRSSACADRASSFSPRCRTSRADARTPDVNALRYEGFCAVMEKHFPGITHDTATITKGMRSPAAERHIAGLMRERKGGFDAVYLIPAYNAPVHPGPRAVTDRAQGCRPPRPGFLFEPLSGKESADRRGVPEPDTAGLLHGEDPGESPGVRSSARYTADHYRAQRHPEREQGPL